MFQDYEKAAAHVHKFLSIDEATLKLTAEHGAHGKLIDYSINMGRIKLFP